MAQFFVKMADSTGISGEATVPNFAGQIECSGLRHAVSLPVVQSSSRVEGASQHCGIEMTHTFDSASPGLKLAASVGSNLGTVEITRMRMIGGTGLMPADTCTIHNTFVVRVEVQTPLNPNTNRPDDEPLEIFSLEYSDIIWLSKEYVNGVEVGQVSGGWSIPTQSTQVG